MDDAGRVVEGTAGVERDDVALAIAASLADQDEIANTVSVAVDAPIVVDPVPDNDSATVVTGIPLFGDGFDGP